MLIKIQKSENSAGICFTENILETAQMNVGDEVQVTTQNGRIIIEGTTRTHKRAELESLAILH